MNLGRGSVFASGISDVTEGGDTSFIDHQCDLESVCLRNLLSEKAAHLQSTLQPPDTKPSIIYCSVPYESSCHYVHACKSSLSMSVDMALDHLTIELRSKASPSSGLAANDCFAC